MLRKDARLVQVLQDFLQVLSYSCDIGLTVVYVHTRIDTFSPHADLDALFEATVLTLVTMVLVDGTVPTAAARVSQVSTDRALEEALAAFARQHSVVLAGAFISADDALG